MARNVDVLACNRRREGSWTFTILGSSKMVSEAFGEMIEVTGKLLDITERFFIPTKIDYGAATYSHDFPANDMHKNNQNRLCTFNRDIIDNNGVSADRFKGDMVYVKCDENNIRGMVRISIKGKTNIILKGGEVYIDEYSSVDICAFFDIDDNPEDTVPECHPLRLDVMQHFGGVEGLAREYWDRACYDITFWTETDIWYEESEIGRANRERLKGVFDKIREGFKVVGTFYEGSAESLFM